MASHVRAKVFQHWARLQTNTAIPTKMQHVVLEKAVTHLKDKGALVRKAAAACITTFLTHNTYGSVLQLKPMLTELKQKEEMLSQFQGKLMGIEELKVEELEKQWEEKIPAARAAIEKILESNWVFVLFILKIHCVFRFADNEEDNANIGEIDSKEAKGLVSLYLKNGNYAEAFAILQKTAEEDPEWLKIK